jgi:alcohol dehydrogenase (cytochrome c)
LNVAVKKKNKAFRFLWLALLLVPLGTAVALAIPSTRWRVTVLAMGATGRLQDIDLRDLVDFVQPSSGQTQIARLISTSNPYAVIHLPQWANATEGGKLFRSDCASCHGPDGSGTPLAPALAGREFKHGESDWAIYRTVRNGVPNTPMAPHPTYSTQQLWHLVSYIRSFKSAASDPRSPEAVQRLNALNVPYDELAGLREPSKDWLTFSGSYASTRHSALDQITPANAGKLSMRWIVQFEGSPVSVQSSPIVRDGILFVTVPPGRVLAIDARTGEQLWKHDHHFDPHAGAEGNVGANRGVAILDDRVFVGTWDAKVTALSAKTGEVIWETAIAEYPAAYISSAPLVYRDLVVTGVGTMVGGGRGVIVALDAKTGRERWRFEALPKPGQPGNETWAGSSWERGGAPTWLTGSYDPQHDVLYWGIGNPKPDYDASVRKGDNLYSNCVVALRGSTGERLWHFQFTPADDHDWDSNQIPVLAPMAGNDPEHPTRLLWANRNGFYYVFVPDTGKLVTAVPYVKQNWATRLDDNGRPIRAKVTFSREGNTVYPGATGGTNWWTPSYDEALGLVFVPVIEQGMVFFSSANSWPTDQGRAFYTAVRALEASTGKLAWERRWKDRTVEPVTGGVLSTKSGLLFGSDQSTFFALESKTGKMLWSIKTGGAIRSPPVTYTVDNEQFVTIAAGGDLLTFALPHEE